MIMKKLLPAIIAILIIPFAFACKKGTNSTGTVTNGVARMELTISPAVSVNNRLYLEIQNRTSNRNSQDIPLNATQYVSDDFAVVEGQNFIYYVTSLPGNFCYSVTGKIFYNNNNISKK